jgi:hypothetical protein
VTHCTCSHPRSFHHVGQDDCFWPECGCSIYEDVDDDVKDVYAPVTPTNSDAYTYNSNPRLAALRHVHTPADFGQDDPEPDPPTMWGWAW